MIITIEKDQKSSIDIKLCESVLDNLCGVLSFKTLPVRTLNEYSSPVIDFSGEIDRIEKILSVTESDLHFFITRRPFDDNWFAHTSGSIVIISFAHWEEYTSLPEENGFLHYIARYVLQDIKDLTHAETTGCVYDFHQIKTGIDLCLKQGRVCSECYKILKGIINGSSHLEIQYLDASTILKAVANVSRMGRSVYSIISDDFLKDFNWETFEDYVADYYRSIGAEVEQDKNISGFQIDIFVSEYTPSKENIRTIIECKFHKNKVGNRIVNDFSRVFSTIRDADLADRAVIVSHSGFTHDARTVAKHSKIKLLHYKDIYHQLREEPYAVKTRKTSLREINVSLSDNDRDPRVFVIMPFTADLDDLYFYGIQSTVNDCGCVCIRMDQELFNGSIIDEIYKNIERSKILIAEVSNPNPNVYYEIGYAHALKREVVLLTNNIKNTPFDLSGFNHIVYSNIRDLSGKLEKRLKALIHD